MVMNKTISNVQACVRTQIQLRNATTVEPPLMETPNKGNPK